ncbi:DUF3179 domain-containing protein [Thalassobaculum sp. OXR-137]|uniref:DUF3179 domain-containing protein n=1 Tax=Thalassobaculum sp. OXR-137 TaxID=3100173 RepID=UPI002AC91A76|nr:DUF3179 domain-containing protein [Thalassobaculum sp. OXR-137]WPZ34369.1 DUF3179 domain-containing protein [Thalassobaculum sp. OXR-137]
MSDPRILLSLLAALLMFSTAALAGNAWEKAWPRTDFSQHSVPLNEIASGGPGRDDIPPIDRPVFADVTTGFAGVAPTEPVVSVAIAGDARAYPLRILIWHEIVNDTVGGVPVAVTYCPLCNTAIVFDRRVEGRPLDFGTTGNIRNSGLIMYDRQTESWWQQYTGEGIVGAMTGEQLRSVPARLESAERFAERHAGGKVLIPNDPEARPYGINPYKGYDTMPVPFLYDGDMPKGLDPMARVVVIGDMAWSLAMLREKGWWSDGDLMITWEPGQNSALDTRKIAEGRDIGNVVVTRDGTDVTHEITFAFVFHAFRPDGKIVY